MSKRQGPIEAEMSVLGAVLLDNTALHEVADALRPEDFADEKHRVLFKGMIEMSARGSPIDEVSLTSHLKANGRIEAAGGHLYTSTLVERTPTAANVTHYAQIVREAAGVRAIYLASRDAMKAIEDGQDVTFVRERITKTFDDLEAREPSKSADMRDELHAIVKEMEKRSESGEAVSAESFVPTGFADIDKAIIGLGSGQLILLMARSRMGKTALAVNIADNLAMNGHHVHFFSAEMSKRELARRSMSSTAKVLHRKLRAGLFEQNDWPRALKTSGQFEKGMFTIDDQSPISTREIRARTMREHRKRKLSAVFIDYAQKVKAHGNFSTREQEVATIAKDLKDLARLGFCVFALAQENRNGGDDYEARGTDKMLRESDVLFQEADVVIRLKRRHVYDKSADPREAVVEVVKQRDGEEVDVKLSFLGEFQRFEDEDPASKFVATPALSGGGHWTDNQD